VANLRQVEQMSVKVDSEKRKIMGPGGTKGGTGYFLAGTALAIIGAFLIMNQTIVTTGYWHWWGASTFGLTLVPLIAGIGVLFFNSRSWFGWMLAAAGLLIILAGILANLQVYFRATSVYGVIVMFGLFTAGLGLIARSFR
jgi:hypothetical protein